ncbi:MAG: plastocyanin/azurin family copper-binding protein [Halobacteriaceae archaeon]
MDTDARVSRRAFLRGTAGAAGVTGTAGMASAQEGGSGPVTVAVGPGGEYVFEPETVYVTPGTTVRWEWESDFHNIVVQSQPSGTNWEGTEGGQNTTYNTGHVYEHTFDTMGTYDYVCWPHRNQGMVGSVVVNQSGKAPSGGEPTLPQSARTLGVAATGAMVSVLGLAYFFMKYGGFEEE